MPLTEEQQRGRLLNAVLAFFEKHLTFPKVYLGADWADETDVYPVDVLAIDRDGIGETAVAVLWDETKEKWPSVISRLMPVPAHFKYVVATSQAGSRDPFSWGIPWSSGAPEMYSPNGIGRIGVITVDPEMERVTPQLALSAERFRPSRPLFKMADAFIANHPADYEVRG